MKRLKRLLLSLLILGIFLPVMTWHAWENRESYSVTLENGYLAEKERIPYTDGASDVYMRTTVYDQDGNTVFLPRKRLNHNRDNV